MFPATLRVLLWIAAVVAVAHAQSSAPPLSASAIVARLADANARRAAALQGFRSVREYQVSYQGFPGDRQASMLVNVEFQAPAAKKFTIVSEQGSKFLLNHVLRRALESEQEAASPENQRQTALNEENYVFELAGNDTVNGRPCYLLQVKPRHGNKFQYAGRIWVDASEFAVLRVEAKPAKNPSFWITGTAIHHEYKRVGEFWLPATNRSTSHVRLGGDAVLTIDYRDYQLLPPASAAGAIGP